MTMTWHYQILRHREKNGSSWCAIHEVYRDIGLTGSYIEDPIAPIGDTAEEVIRTLEMMLADARKWPVKDVAP